MPQMSQVLRERAIGKLTAGMSTRAVSREFNVNFSTISRLQRRFREFGSTSNQPHNCRARIWRHVASGCQQSAPWWRWGYGVVPNAFISIDWFPHMNGYSVKSMKLLDLYLYFIFLYHFIPFIFLFSIIQSNFLLLLFIFGGNGVLSTGLLS